MCSDHFRRPTTHRQPSIPLSQEAAQPLSGNPIQPWLDISTAQDLEIKVVTEQSSFPPPSPFRRLDRQQCVCQDGPLSLAAAAPISAFWGGRGKTLTIDDYKEAVYHLCFYDCGN